MKRLTTNRSWEEANEDLENELGYSHIWKRLNAIENILGDDYDLGRLRELVEAYREDRYIVLKEPRQAGVHRLSELAEADREGRCVVLPAKLGDVVYCISERLDETTGKRYKSVSQKKVTFTQSLPDLVECEGFVYTFDEFGKTIFRDKEAAQAALERMKKDG